VDKNLISPRPHSDGELRFVMLETIHQYAADRLEASGEAEIMRALQAGYLAELVPTAQAELYGARQAYWLGRLRDELDNLRAVLTWSLNGSQRQYGLQLTAALREFWIWDGLAAEGRRWTDRALSQSDQARPELRAGVLLSAGHIALAYNDAPRGRELLILQR
jgi:predicted ATPase